jgi:hypothetical protein
LYFYTDSGSDTSLQNIDSHMQDYVATRLQSTYLCPKIRFGRTMFMTILLPMCFSVPRATRVAQKVIPHVFCRSKYLLKIMKITHIKARRFVYRFSFSTKSPSISTALRQRVTSVCMPCLYHSLSCSVLPPVQNDGPGFICCNNPG